MRAALLAIAACSSAPQPVAVAPHPATVADRMIGLLPDGAQVVIELDLARLRANPVVGAVVRDALERGPELPSSIHLPGSPLGAASRVVLAAYGVGTAQAATITLLATKEDVPEGRRLDADYVALGPADWVDQVAARAQHAGAAAPELLLALRDHAMPAGAPGATLRVTARLPFDARVALARQTGLDITPAQLSIWADVVDDLAIVVDADAADPGDKSGKTAAKKLARGMRGVLGVLAEVPAIRALGIPASLDGARVVTEGSWVRTVIAIGPAHLQRVVTRALALLHPEPPIDPVQAVTPGAS